MQKDAERAEDQQYDEQRDLEPRYGDGGHRDKRDAQGPDELLAREVKRVGERQPDRTCRAALEPAVDVPDVLDLEIDSPDREHDRERGDADRDERRQRAGPAANTGAEV